MLGCVMERQDRAHRKAAHDDRATIFAQTMSAPARHSHTSAARWSPLVPRRSRNGRRGVSRTGETLGDVAHFHGCAPEPVDKKETLRPSGKAKTSIVVHMHLASWGAEKAGTWR